MRNKETNDSELLENIGSRAQATFYPTPPELADKLLSGIDWYKVGSVLEPSAGKGDLAQYAANKLYNANRHYTVYDERTRKEAVEHADIDCVEIDPLLREHLEKKGFRVVADDFRRFETMKRYDLIVMNPPFDQGAEHLLKALEMQTRGGIVRCILNAETLRNPFSATRQQLVKELARYGAKIEYMAKAFHNAERKTDVDIAIVAVEIPAVELDSDIMQGMQEAPTYKTEAFPEEYAEIVQYNQIDEWVNRYNFEVACGIRLIEEYRAMCRLMPEETGVEGSILTLKVHTSGGHDKEAYINSYIREVRGKYWRKIFQQPTFTDKLTVNLLNDLRDYVRTLMDYDFSAYNILTLLIKMNKKVVGGIEETIMGLFDDWTRKYSWRDENSPNRHYFDGWKTKY